MNAEKRQTGIVAAVAREGRVHVAELATRYGVTVETIRRDLGALDRAGALRKVHGGAVPVPVSASPETGVAERELAAAPAKAAIAAAALAALEPAKGMSILLDAGTTTAALARLLPTGLDLRVITDSLLIATLLAPREGISVRVLGGQVRGMTQAAVGPEALDALAHLRVDVTVLGANGISAEHGLSTPDPDEAAVKRAMARAGRRVLALADASKIGQEHLVSFADTADVDLLITNAPLPDPLASQLSITGTEVRIA
ncbi:MULTISPECIES: DeoR/GlpR family DNA-binding transcription regulator [Actinomyces]|uniref:Lactose phosphotransferase system repressor n=1 Tax=Actinomyces marmotae TaxID=2737173 RepID=A0A6M8B838_9ACTO|nr:MULTISPECIES: DeoR/GlpR family DNA-binding transcription regulator [Actinomyces]QKD79075.1 DeoR/GlpR transcriptional regulator [Actinomyces marmotae]